MASAPTVQVILLAALVGYLLGSIPIAMLVSRIRNVDIFSAGTGLAGAANVYRNVGSAEGLAVFYGDAAKGILTIVAAYRFGLEGEMVLVPAIAALMGHWRSVFTRFRGGDGVSTMIGITVAVFPLYGLLSVVTGFAVAGIARAMGHHASLWGGGAGYGFLLLRVPLYQEDTALVLGVVLLAIIVLVHGVLGHRRRAASA